MPKPKYKEHDRVLVLPSSFTTFLGLAGRHGTVTYVSNLGYVRVEVDGHDSYVAALYEPGMPLKYEEVELL